MQISDKELVQFFKSVGADVKCPFCHKTFWGHPTTGPTDHPPDVPREAITASMALRDDDGDLVGTASFMPIMCGNCGYTKLHHAKIIQDWLDNNREASDEEQ